MFLFQGLHAINLGDSGFTVVRDGTTVFQSPVQQHGFNFTYQLGCGDSGGDMPRSGQVCSPELLIRLLNMTTLLNKTSKALIELGIHD